MKVQDKLRNQPSLSAFVRTLAVALLASVAAGRSTYVQDLTGKPPPLVAYNEQAV